MRGSGALVCRHLRYEREYWKTIHRNDAADFVGMSLSELEGDQAAEAMADNHRASEMFALD